MTDYYGNIIHRMVRQLAEEYTNSIGAPRCDGCGWRVELAPYHRRMSDGGTETLDYCVDCRAQAMIELVEDGDSGSV